MTRSVIVAIALAVALAAPGQDSRPPVVAVDVHVLEIATPAEDFVPATRIVATTRLSPGAGGTSEAEITVPFGRSRLTLKADSTAEGGVVVTRRQGPMISSAPVDGTALDLSDRFHWTRRPGRRARVRSALLVEPVQDAATRFVALDVRGFVRRAVDLLLEAPAKPRLRAESVRAPAVHVFREALYGLPGSQHEAALLLGCLPLGAYLDRDQEDRIREAGSKVRHALGGAHPVLARPLVVLGDRRTLEALEIYQDGAPDVDGAIVPPRIPGEFEDAVFVAYASATDPAIRGLAGWLALGTRDPRMAPLLAGDVASGRATLPGDPARQAAAAEHLGALRSWQSIGAPAATFAASALLIVAVLSAIRRSLRGML
jgi:hypothetical protein